MASKQLEKTRAKGRKNRVTIEDKYLGYEPFWDEQNPPPTDESDRKSTWSKAAQWYNYFNKPKDYTPFTLKYAKEEEILSNVKDYKKYNDEVIFPDKVKINLDYINNWSFFLDIKIIFKTIFRKNY